MPSGRVEIEGLGDQGTRAEAIAQVGNAFPSLSPGRRQDLVDVAAALLDTDATSTRRKPTRLLVELDRGRLRGEVDYRKLSLLPRSTSARMAGWVRDLAPVNAIARSWGVSASGSGIWFDLGRN